MKLSRARALCCAAGLVAVAVGATGCVNVPTGGRVVAGQSAERAEPLDDPYVRLIPVPPGRDWLPEQIVKGFLVASASFDGGHAVARMYLGPNVAWEPGPRPEVAVYDGVLDVVPVGGADEAAARWQVTGTQVGTIGADGQYEARSDRVDKTFQLAKDEAGRWRITGLPHDLRNGLLLGLRDVERAFRTLNLYFFTPDRTVMVPNPIFLPLVNRRDLPSQLVRAALAGPTRWLGEAVWSEFPRGTRLLGDKVDVTDGVATVNLSKEAAKGSLSGMSAQLMWTLRQLPEVAGLRLQVDGETVSPPGKGATQTPNDWRNNDADLTPPQSSLLAYLRDADGRFQRLQSDIVSNVDVTRGAPIYHPAISLDERSVAGLTESGDTVLVGDIGGAAPRPVLRAAPGGRFTTPTWDRSGTFWVVENDGRGNSRLWLGEPGKAPVEAPLWELDGHTVTALRVARDGVRVAAIADMDGSRQIQMGRIIRVHGVRTATSFLPISSEIVDATDLAWRNANELAVLGSTQRDTQLAPYLIPVSGGAIRKFGTGGGEMTSITAMPRAPVLVGMKVRDEKTNEFENRICRQQDEGDPLSGWTFCTPKGHDPAYPG
jgi:hypothetical protein